MARLRVDPLRAQLQALEEEQAAVVRRFGRCIDCHEYAELERDIRRKRDALAYEERLLLETPVS